MPYSKLKRIFDLVLSLMLLAVVWPIMVAVALLIYIKMGHPVVFKQQRPGLEGRLFDMYKFRTMLSAQDAPGLSDQERITALGRFLRATSLDELPELINVIKGEMSLVGPRPLLVEYLDKYSDTQMRRHDVLPGITGLAQVRGRNELNWENKFRYDVFYADKLSWRLDFFILCATMKTVLFREGFRDSGEERKFGE